jgi:hypothetical protein
MMTEISITIQVVHLRDEYERRQALFLAQKISVQQSTQSHEQCQAYDKCFLTISMK